MDQFPAVQDAKEYLISRILAQADRDGVSLSDIERKMLYFSEAGWTLPNMMAISEDFDSTYNHGEYEEKIGEVIRHIHSLPKERSDNQSWNDAVHRLRSEDHYLLVLIDGASKARVNRSPTDALRLIVAAIFTIAVLLTATFVVYSRIGNENISKLIIMAVFVVTIALVMLFANRR
jgi:hypothetical protein